MKSSPQTVVTKNTLVLYFTQPARNVYCAHGQRFTLTCIGSQTEDGPPRSVLELPSPAWRCACGVRTALSLALPRTRPPGLPLRPGHSAGAPEGSSSASASSPTGHGSPLSSQTRRPSPSRLSVEHTARSQEAAWSYMVIGHVAGVGRTDARGIRVWHVAGTLQARCRHVACTVQGGLAVAGRRAPLRVMQRGGVSQETYVRTHNNVLIRTHSLTHVLARLRTYLLTYLLPSSLATHSPPRETLLTNVLTY